MAIGADSIFDAATGVPGTPGGSPTYRADVPVPIIPQTNAVNNLSMEFDGASEVVFGNLFQFHIPGDATMEFWIKFDSSAHESILWTTLEGVDTNRYNVFTNFTSPDSFNIDPRVSTPGIFSPAVPVAPSVWTHLAVVRVGDADYSVYKNGILFGHTVNAAALPTAIGWTISGRPGFRYHGFIDELRVSDGALSPSEFLNAPGVPEPGGFLLPGAALVLFGLWGTLASRRRPGL